jgi:hypothetical protein
MPNEVAITGTRLGEGMESTAILAVVVWDKSLPLFWENLISYPLPC